MTSYDLTRAAEEDLRGIWDYSFETWGAAQADLYLDRIGACCESIGGGRVVAKSFTALPQESGSIVASITTSSGWPPSAW